ncbi:hypothetical protein BV25DRAFT_1833476 [Artomyces pyxidatus]|uniref:Uncharacterized protein n=1 Tax=Artomyces pyxidatus TaxID=48021 RepID=A0ACB8SG58_9AGAM|nr:hypothetical protein BV25DRAFT_1833476 [Artomyces pyxidatus]
MTPEPDRGAPWQSTPSFRMRKRSSEATVSSTTVKRRKISSKAEDLRDIMMAENATRTRCASKAAGSSSVCNDMAYDELPHSKLPTYLRDTVRPARVLRIALDELAPNVTRSGRELLTAWADCVKYHYALWAAGIKHSDLSLDNLMVRVARAPGGAEVVSGVMVDWDLAVSDHADLERMGPLPFQALNALSGRYWQRRMERLYRHKLESLIWVLPWVFLRMKGERTVKNPPLDAWQTNDYLTCYEKKLVFLQDRSAYKASPSWRMEWNWAKQLLAWIEKENLYRRSRVESCFRCCRLKTDLRSRQRSAGGELQRRFD